MSDHAPIFLTVRGIAKTETLEAARKLHNETAGSPQGVAAARSLGDLSHNVYVPVPNAMGSAKQGELLFLDTWQEPKGLMDFFGNPDVQHQAGRLFGERDAAVWMPATGAFAFQLPAPARRTDRLIGMLRGRVASPEKAIAAFRALHQKGLRDARRRGQLSHQLYIKINPPGVDAPLEALGVDVWYDAAGMAEHYKSLDMNALAPIFTAAPDATVWQQAPGEWSEW